MSKKKTVKSIAVVGIIVILLSTGAYFVAQVNWQGMMQDFMFLSGVNPEVKSSPTHDELAAEAEYWGIDVNGMTDDQIHDALKDTTSQAKQKSSGAKQSNGSSK